MRKPPRERNDFESVARSSESHREKSDAIEGELSRVPSANHVLLTNFF